MIGVSKSVLSKVRILKEYFAENPAVIYYKRKEMNDVNSDDGGSRLHHNTIFFAYAYLIDVKRIL